jgi:hypothetical protein
MPKLTLAFDTKGVVVPATTFVQATDPAWPNVGVVPQVNVLLTVVPQFHPAGTEENDTVVLAGTYSVRVIAPVVLGPMFWTVWV